MSALEIYVLFILPAVICAAAGIGILVLKRGLKPTARRTVKVEVDLTNVVPMRTANE